MSKLDVLKINDDEDDTTEFDATNVINNVHKFIAEVCDCSKDSIPYDVVIPVYGLWAFKARMLASEPNERRRDDVVKILSSLSCQPSGQEEHPGLILLQQSNEQLSRNLEQISKICELEER